MKLIFIYGSPAVGKLTVANEIAKQTDFKVFPNHLTIEAVAPVFDFGTKPFWKLIHLFRIKIIAEAARQNVDMIFTYCYAKDSDDAFVERIIKAVEENGGEICFVLLTAEKRAIEKRILEESRLKYGKMKDIEHLHKIWDENELFSPVPERTSLIIDNTNISAKNTAKMIIEHFNLQ